jgi:hypothetical protein
MLQEPRAERSHVAREAEKGRRRDGAGDTEELTAKRKKRAHDRCSTDTSISMNPASAPKWSNHGNHPGARVLPRGWGPIWTSTTSAAGMPISVSSTQPVAKQHRSERRQN